MRRIADLIYTERAVNGRLAVEHVAKLFDAEPSLEALATLEQDGSFGLVLRSRLTHDLGRRFGYALFARKPIHTFNEPSFLSCDASEEPVKVISEATKRPESSVYDDIVVTQAGASLGLVSMRRLMAHGKDLLARSMAEVNALELQNQRLDQLNRAQREFVTNVTHELRSPLNTMLGVAHLLSLDPELSAARQRDVRMLLSRGRDLSALVNNMLELYRLESGEIKPQRSVTQLRELLDDCVEATRYLILERPVELVQRYDTLPETGLVDAVLLRRVLTNLLSNAAKFTERGQVTLCAKLEADQLEIEVSDTGIGIKPEDMPKLFRKFTQLEATKTKRYTGTGLGLAIVGDLVSLMNGQITVRSSFGSGTTFTVAVPTGPSPAPESA